MAREEPGRGAAASRRAELGFGRLFDQISDAVVVADARGTIVLWNRAAERLFGWSADEAVGLDVQMLVPERLREAHVSGVRRFAETGRGEVIARGHPLQVPAVRKDGVETSVELTLSALEDNGRYAVAIIRDVSHRDRLEELVRERDARSVMYGRLAHLALELGAARDEPTIHRALLAFVREETPMSGMFVSRYDPAGGLRTCVYAYSDGAEVDASELPPLPLTQSPHSRAIATGEPVVTGDFDASVAGVPRIDVGLDRDPRLPRSSLVVPMVAGDRILGALEIQSVEPDAFHADHVAVMQLAGNLAAIATENARHLREAETRAQELERTVARRTRELADTNRELEAFSYTVAHDLRAPLRAMLYLAHSVLHDHRDELPREAAENLERVEESGRRMGALIDDLLKLALATKRDLRREDVDLTAVAREVVANLKAREPGRDVTLRIQEGLAAHADRGLVEIVLDNLLRNAWKFSRSKPSATIEVGARDEPRERVFFVRDEGVGFDPSKSHLLFSAFQRLHPANEYEGTGIGLATVARVVHHHGGRVWAEGEPGRGATFYFTLEPPRP